MKWWQAWVAASAFAIVLPFAWNIAIAVPFALWAGWALVTPSKDRGWCIGSVLCRVGLHRWWIPAEWLDPSDEWRTLRCRRRCGISKRVVNTEEKK